MSERAGAEFRAALAGTVATLALAWTRAQAMAFYVCEGRSLDLVASDRVDQSAINYVTRLWTRSPLPPPLEHGTPYHGGGDGCAASVIVPCVVAGRVRGLLYLEEPASADPSAAHMQVLGRFLGALLESGAAPSEGLTVEEPEASNLVALLERYDWNVSRVARALGVTRMTVYNRMRRLAVPRRHLRRRRTAPAA